MKIYKTISLILIFALMISIAPQGTEPLNLSGTVSPITTSEASSGFIISNPYENVNWSTFHQFKAGLHNHSTQSDGRHSVTEMADRLYSLGFHIMSFNEHDVITPSPDRTLTGVSTDSTHAGQARTPLSLERIARMEAGLATRTTGGGHGMIFVPYSNEPSGLAFEPISTVSGITSSNHINTYWTNAPRVSGETIPGLLSRMNTVSPDGLAILNHPGRNTGALITNNDYPNQTRARNVSNNPAIVTPYADLFMNNPNLIGLEIMNKLDPETRADRILWNNILSITMPQGRNIWGSSTDDAHHTRDVGFSYNLMLMPSLSLSEFRRSFETGAFFAFARADKDYGIFPGRIDRWTWMPSGDDHMNSSNAVNEVLNLPTPQISEIVVNETLGTITLAATGFNTVSGTDHTGNRITSGIKWYSDSGEIIAARDNLTLNLNTHAASIGSFVRATVSHSQHGVLYVQPFGIQHPPPRALPNLVSITPPTPVTVPTGSALTQMGLRLPGGVRITTTAGTRPATVMWQNLSTLTYNPASIRCQTLNVSGTVLLNGVANPSSVNLNTSVAVTARCVPLPEPCICQCGDCGDCRFCDPCLSCFGTCRQTCSHKHCTKTYFCTTCTFCTRAPTPHSYSWTASNIELTGNENFIRAFNLDLKERFDNLTAVNTDFVINFSPPATATRRILVWTDLSLSSPPHTNLVTSSNISNNRILRLNPRLSGTNHSTSMSIPLSMLFNANTGQFASKIYVLSTTDSTNYDRQPGHAESIYRHDPSDVISTATITVTGLPSFNDGNPPTDDPPTDDPTTVEDKLFSIQQSNSFIELTNITEHTLTTRGLYLTNTNDVFLWQMPSVVIRPNEKIIIGSLTHEATQQVKWKRTNFDMTAGQTVRLIDGKGNTLSQLTVYD
jgi:hypothetical protein